MQLSAREASGGWRAYGGDAIEARRQQLADGALLRVREHVLEQLYGRDREGEVVAFAVARSLEEVGVGVGGLVEGLHL